MQIKQDPISGLYCRSDGAILMPPSGIKYKSFRWAFGCRQPTGYRAIQFQGRTYSVHQIVCRSFNGLAPEGKSEVDHINRIRDDNRPENLRWVDRKENQDNADRVDQSIEKYGVRYCEEYRAYARAYRTAHPERSRAWGKAYRERHK